MSFFRFFALSALTLSVIGCSGSGSAGGNTPATTSTPASVTGFLSKGPVDGATCKLINANNQILVTAESVEGEVDFGEISETGLLTIECSGGTYIDEATGNSVNLEGVLNSVVEVASGQSIQVAITPLTQMAYLRAGGNPAKVAQEAQVVANALGLTGVNLLTTIPTDVNTQEAKNDAAGKYGTLLATFAEYMHNKNFGLKNAITHVAGSISNEGANSTLRTDLQNATAQLSTGPHNLGSSNAAEVNIANHVSAVTENIKDNIKTGRDIASISLITTNPKTLAQGATGNANWTLTGTGFPANGTGTVVIKLNDTNCNNSGTVGDVMTVTGIDCSNVTIAPGATTTKLSAVVTLTGQDSITKELTIELTPLPWSDIAFSSNPTVVRLGTPDARVQARSIYNNALGAITYTSSNPDIATVDASSGAITAVKTGKTIITAKHLATSKFAETSIGYELSVIDKAIPVIRFEPRVKEIAMNSSLLLSTIATSMYAECEGDANYRNWITTATYKSLKNEYNANLQSNERQERQLKKIIDINTTTGIVTPVPDAKGTDRIEVTIPEQGACAAGVGTYMVEIN